MESIGLGMNLTGNCSERGSVLPSDVASSALKFTVGKLDGIQRLLWLYAVFALVGNLLVVAWRCTRPKEEKYSGISLLVLSLAVADFVYGIRLLLYNVALYETSDWCQTESVTTVCRVALLLALPSNIGMWTLTITIAVFWFRGVVGFGCSPAETKRSTVVGVLVFDAVVTASLSIFIGILDDVTVDWKGSRVVDWTQCSPGADLVRLDTLGESHSRLFSAVYFGTGLVGILFAASLYFIFFVRLCCRRCQNRRRNQRGSNEEVSVFARGLGARLAVIIFLQIFAYSDAPWRVIKNDFLLGSSVNGTLVNVSNQFYYRITLMGTILSPLYAPLHPVLYTILTKPFLNCVFGWCIVQVMACFFKVKSLMGGRPNPEYRRLKRHYGRPCSESSDRPTELSSLWE